MSIRSNSILLGDTLSLQLRDVLRRNGMHAHVTMEGSQYMLHVQGHDSPQLSYKISRNQYLAMVEGGTNSSNKNAYKTFVNIVSNDFYCPKNYVHARNANSTVTMGLHGYRLRDRGYTPTPFFSHNMPHGFPHRPMLGWTPRQQAGYHMRRVNGELAMIGGPMIPERRDGYMKPGELQSGAYGFYYKGNQQQQQVSVSDPLKELQAIVKPVEIKKEPAKPYRELISSAVYFTNEKWQECLDSHGIKVDAENKKLIVQNAGTPYAPSYELTDQQVKDLTNNSLKGDSVYHRIDIINGIIANDFENKLTFDMLNSKEQPDLRLKPEAKQRLFPEPVLNEQIHMEGQEVQRDQRLPGMDNHDGVNGQSLEVMNKGWYRQINNGREVNVGEIWVEKAAEHEGKYKMSAVINGQIVSHEISQKQHDKFLALDDYHRMKLFDKVFDEVKMKSYPGQGLNFGQALMAGLGVATTLTRGAAEIAHDIEHIKHPHGYAPEVYVEEHRHGRIFIKPGLDTPESIAARAFDAGMNQGFQNAMLHR